MTKSKELEIIDESNPFKIDLTEDLSTLEVTPEEHEKADRIKDFFKTYGIDPEEIDYEKLLSSTKKKAYPNYGEYVNIPGQRDINKWLEAVRTLYYKENNGVDRLEAIKQVTANWNHMETYDFLNWMRFYEEGAHLKYKVAQHMWYEGAAPGYFLPIKKDVQESSSVDINTSRDTSANEVSKAERKNIIEKQRQKIIGRLDSAEKLLRSEEGQLFAGKELESLMESIYNLKKKIQLVNKVSTSIRLYEDMIIREANILNKKGFNKAANKLYTLAQTPGQSAEQTGASLSQDPLAPAPPAPPGEGSGSVGGLPSMGPGMPQNPPDSAPNEESPVDSVKSKGIEDFLKAINTSNITDANESKDELEVVDFADEMVVEAQVAPPAAPPPPPLKSEAPPKLEVSEDDLDKAPAPDASKRDFDHMVDAAFANLKVDDVVAKLEDLAKIFKTREVPRQLAIVDMMLDSLGLASYFPSLSEATNKALESNNYISTRVEDILSKLRGAMETNEIDLRGGDTERPEIAPIKEKLKSDEAKEKARKELRKKQENEELELASKETPEVDIKEDLGEVPTPAAPLPPKPPAPPAAV